MADTRSGTRRPVPIALGSAASGTEEGREFFQARLALFGRWWAAFTSDRRDGSAAPPLSTTGQQTITVDVSQGVTR